MATKKKMLQAAAGNATGGAGLDVEEVFSTYLYDGTGSTQTIANGIDLDGEGGLVWIKSRSNGYDNQLFDTERGALYRLQSNVTDASSLLSNTLTSFNSTGFGIGGESVVGGSGTSFASWTFRKAPKFFDVVTYTGTGSAQNISHSLDSVPGMVVVKKTTTGGANSNWTVWHNGLSDNSKYLRLNKSDAEATASSQFNGTAPTSTVFSVGASSNTNADGETYIAYLFAHNDGDGEFGPDGDADIIKCGSFTGNGSTQTIDLGFEPQFVLIKRASGGTSSWLLHDTMRGIATGGNDTYLKPDTSDAEVTTGTSVLDVTSTGFYLPYGGASYNASGSTYIYIAIRRGTKVPESGTEVFAADDETYTNLPQFYSGWPVDFALRRLGKNTTNYTRVIDRLRGNQFLRSDSTNAESALTIDWDVMDGFSVGTSSSADDFSWMWKRAPNFFEVVAYEGNSTSGRTVSHNLGVAPEMMWVKGRSNGASWYVYTEATGNDQSMLLNDNSSAGGGNSWNYTTPSDSSFTLRNTVGVNRTGDTYIAYLFATLPGVSKVGSYTGNGSSQTIDCGFTSGARFILIKRTDGTGDWYIWDSVRGIVSGNDPHISLNNASAEVSDDSIDPDSSGFIVNQDAATSINVSSAEYIFYAIA